MTAPNQLTAKAIAKRLDAAGYGAVVEAHGLAVKIFNSDDADYVQRLAVLWLPIGEPTPTGLGFKYLWGPTGDEHQAEDSTGVDELVQLVLGTLPPAVAA